MLTCPTLQLPNLALPLTDFESRYNACEPGSISIWILFWDGAEAESGKLEAKAVAHLTIFSHSASSILASFETVVGMM